MKCYPDKFQPGIQITLSYLDSALPMQGEVIANYGLYLIIKSQNGYQLMPGQQIKVTSLSEEENLGFDSYVCFLDDLEQAQSRCFCIYVPPDLGKKELRKYLRLNLELELTYKINGLTVPSKTINISAGGAYFFTPDRLYIGQEIELELYLPGDVLSLRGKVVRTMLNAASIEFIDENRQIDRLASHLYRCSRIS